MPNVNDFHNKPRDFAHQWVEQGLISYELLATALLKAMSHDQVRSALEANELDPRFIHVECSACNDPDFQGMDGEFDEDGYTFTCDTCLAERDDDDDDDGDDD